MNIEHIYNNIATDFNRTRYKVWPCVANFLDKFKSNDKILDIGCGNGKNMLYRTDLNVKGIDLSEEFIKICKNKKLDVELSNMTQIKLSDLTFDGIMTIASYHHLNNDIDRKKALDEMYRLLKHDGLCCITVWAMEQDGSCKFIFTKSDEMVPWTEKYTGKIFYRYYHIYSKGELMKEITTLKPEFKIIDEIWEKGNWIILLQK